MQLIELLGLPGSGKSSLISLINEKFKQKGLNVYLQKDLFVKYICKNNAVYNTVLKSNFLKTKTIRLAQKGRVHDHFKLKFITKNPVLMERLLSWANEKSVSQNVKSYRNKSLTDAMRVLGWFLDTASFYQMGKEILPEDSVLILDEGFTQKVISLFSEVDTPPKEEQIYWYLNHIPRIDKVIYLKLLPEIALERMEKRYSTYRLRDKTREEKLNFMKNSFNGINFAAEILTGHQTEIITLDNSKALESQKEIQQNYIQLLAPLEEKISSIKNDIDLKTVLS